LRPVSGEIAATQGRPRTFFDKDDFDEFGRTAFGVADTDRDARNGHFDWSLAVTRGRSIAVAGLSS
jgi:hypothetical protein